MIPSLNNCLGRYECVDASSNTRKFWTLTYNEDSGLYEAYWGRIGAKPQGPATYDGAKALKKVQEKISKGYTLVVTNSETIKEIIEEVNNFLDELRAL